MWGNISVLFLTECIKLFNGKVCYFWLETLSQSSSFLLAARPSWSERDVGFDTVWQRPSNLLGWNPMCPCFLKPLRPSRLLRSHFVKLVGGSSPAELGGYLTFNNMTWGTATAMYYTMSWAVTKPCQGKLLLCSITLCVTCSSVMGWGRFKL